MAVNNTPDFMGMAVKVKRDAIRYASIKGVNFIQENFQKQGFTNTAFEPWQKRAGDIDPGRKLLVKSSFIRKFGELFVVKYSFIEEVQCMNIFRKQILNLYFFERIQKS